MDDHRLSAALAALGHPIRLGLFRRLVAAGEAGIGPVALGALSKIPRNLVSYHLRPLVAAGLVTSERRGRDVAYRVEGSGLERLACTVRALGAASDTYEA